MSIKSIFRSKCLLTFALAAAGCAFTCFLWALFPWPDRTYIREGELHSIRVEETRRYRTLPLREWGFSHRELCFCGPTSGELVEARLGFVEVTDMSATTYIKRAK